MATEENMEQRYMGLKNEAEPKPINERSEEALKA